MSTTNHNSRRVSPGGEQSPLSAQLERLLVQHEQVKELVQRLVRLQAPAPTPTAAPTPAATPAAPAPTPTPTAAPAAPTQAGIDGPSLKQLWESELRNTSIGNQRVLGDLLKLERLHRASHKYPNSFKLVSKDDNSMIKLPVSGGEANHGQHGRTAYVYLDENCIVTPWERARWRPADDDSIAAWIKFNSEIIDSHQQWWERIVQPLPSDQAVQRHVPRGGHPAGWILLPEDARPVSSNSRSRVLSDDNGGKSKADFGFYKYTLASGKETKGKGRWLFEHRATDVDRTIIVIKNICNALKNLKN